VRRSSRIKTCSKFKPTVVICLSMSPVTPHYLSHPTLVLFLTPSLILPTTPSILPSPRSSCPPAHLGVCDPHPGGRLQGQVRGRAAPGSSAAPPQPPGAFRHSRGRPGAGQHAVSSPPKLGCLRLRVPPTLSYEVPGDQTSNLPVARQPALPPEPLYCPCTYIPSSRYAVGLSIIRVALPP